MRTNVTPVARTKQDDAVCKVKRQQKKKKLSSDALTG